MHPLFDQVLLNQHRVAFEAATLALPGDRAHPLQRQVGSLGEPAGILDVIPNSVRDAPEFPLDALAVVNGVQFAAPFDPPLVTAGVAAANDPLQRNRRRRNVFSEARRHIFDRMAHIFRIK